MYIESNIKLELLDSLNNYEAHLISLQRKFQRLLSQEVPLTESGSKASKFVPAGKQFSFTQGKLYFNMLWSNNRIQGCNIKVAMGKGKSVQIVEGAYKCTRNVTVCNIYEVDRIGQQIFKAADEVTEGFVYLPAHKDKIEAIKPYFVPVVITLDLSKYSPKVQALHKNLVETQKQINILKKTLRDIEEQELQRFKLPEDIQLYLSSYGLSFNGTEELYKEIIKDVPKSYHSVAVKEYLQRNLVTS